MKTSSPDFTDNTKRILAKMASERCCICGELTSKPNFSNDNFVNTGEAAHIFGARKRVDLRFDEKMTDADRKHYLNGIWLCSNCHAKIDKDEKEYTPVKLKQLREEHYNRIKKGEYDKSNFAKIDTQNREIELLNQQILDKERLLNNNEKIYNLELTAFRIKVETLINEREKLWKDYMSILENMDQAENFEKLYKLVFEEGNLKGALRFLTDENLQKEEVAIVKKYLLKADICKLQNNVEAINYYKKAYKMRNTFEVASFYIRYLDGIRDFATLIELVDDVLKSEKRPEKILVLRGKLGSIYTKLNPDLAINEFLMTLQIIENELKTNVKYLLYKAAYLNNLAIAYKCKGDIKTALDVCQNSFAIFLTGKVEGIKTSEAFNEFCNLYNLIAQLYEENLNYKEAEIYYSLALKICNEQIKDNYEQKIAILINFSQLYTRQTILDIPNSISLIDEAISIITSLYDKQPLKYAEMFIGAICKKADYELLLSNNSKFLLEIEKAENLINQYITLNYKGFQYLLAEIGSRKMMYFFSERNIKNAIEQLDNTILIYELSNLNNIEFIQKYVLLLIVKCNYLSDKEMKQGLLNKAKLMLQPFLNNFNSVILLDKQIDEMVKNIA